MTTSEPTVGERKKPGPKKGTRPAGRKKGTPNKITGEVKAMVLAALDAAGGVDYLAKQANETPAAFMALVGKVLPLQVAGDPNQPIVTRIVHEIVRASPASR